MKYKKSSKKLHSLRKNLMAMIILCWIVPISFISTFILLSYRNSIMAKTEDIMDEELKNLATFTSYKIEEAVNTSKQLSYEGHVEDAWWDLQEDYNRLSFTISVQDKLKLLYYNDSRFSMSALFLTDYTDSEIFPVGTSVETLDRYYSNVSELAKNISKINTTDTFIRILNGRVYIIRNLYTIKRFKKYGTLVLELDNRTLFVDTNISPDFECGIFINGSDDALVKNSHFMEGDTDKREIYKEIKNRYDTNNKSDTMNFYRRPYGGLLYMKRFNSCHMGAFLITDLGKLYSELIDLYIITVIILCILIPLLFYIIGYISKNITNPIEQLIWASKQVQKGNIGMQIEGGPMPNREFNYLKESFNKMSSEVKYLFDFAYDEKLARKDAKIMALQSQINPHFLNNTLEMMNWQARMAGDITVSKMIEALGTLLDYSMDRDNKRLISLAEELRCADAYFYIISMRFGQRLLVEKEIDNDLLQIQVPQLILQPLLENAVVHGIEVSKKGTITLKVFREKEEIILQIVNTGSRMTEKDIEKVHLILNNKSEKIQGKGKHVSLGIRNVNERIKLIYGEEYGLSIMPGEGDETISTIRIPFNKKTDQDKNKLLTKMLE